MTVYEILTDQLHSLLIVDVCSCCVVCCRKFSSTPDDLLFRELAKSYSLPHSLMAHSPKCPGDSHPFAQGITNGADWYPVAGGMQVSHCSRRRSEPSLLPKHPHFQFFRHCETSEQFSPKCLVPLHFFFKIPQYPSPPTRGSEKLMARKLIFRSRIKNLTTCAIVSFFSPDLSVKILNFSKAVHTIFINFCTVILHPKGPLRAQRHQNRMTEM